jgi:hypothetical protein
MAKAILILSKQHYSSYFKFFYLMHHNKLNLNKKLYDLYFYDQGHQESPI